MAYQLTENDLEYIEWNTASVQAACNSSPAILKALITRYYNSLNHWDELSEMEKRYWKDYGPNTYIRQHRELTTRRLI